MIATGSQGVRVADLRFSLHNKTLMVLGITACIHTRPSQL